MSFRKLVGYPLAAPPGGRRLPLRLAPELCALAVWGLFFYVWMTAEGPSRLGLWESLDLVASRFDVVPSGEHLSAGLSRAARLACAAGGFLMILAPVAFAASAFAAERERGTLEAMLLTSTHHNLLVRGRFWYVALPWFRLAGYLLPLYLLMGFEPLFTLSSSGWSVAWLNLLGWVARLGEVPGKFSWESAVTAGPAAHSFFLAAMRWMHDLSAMVLAAGAAFHVSLRARSTIRSAVVSFLLVPPLVAVVFSPDLVWLLVSAAAKSVFLHQPAQSYWLVALLVMALRWGAVFWMLGRSARNFDAYVLGEKPDPQGGGARARRRVRA